MIFPGKNDRFHGITVFTAFLKPEARENFEENLEESLNSWKKTNRRGIWFNVSLQDAILVPILIKHGFVYHHAQKDFVMLTKWLPNELNNLPLYAHTHIGVGGLVEDSNGRILMMREKRQRSGYFGWKFPGGLSDPGEDIFQTAAREVFEETGVQAIGETVILFRQSTTSQFPGVGDIYFVVSMSLKDANNSEIKVCPQETEEARWFTLHEIETLSDDDLAPFVKRIMLEFRKNKGKEVNSKKEAGEYLQAMRQHTIDFNGRKMIMFMAGEGTGSHL